MTGWSSQLPRCRMGQMHIMRILGHDEGFDLGQSFRRSCQFVHHHPEALKLARLFGDMVVAFVHRKKRHYGCRWDPKFYCISEG